MFHLSNHLNTDQYNSHTQNSVTNLVRSDVLKQFQSFKRSNNLHSLVDKGSYLLVIRDSISKQSVVFTDSVVFLSLARTATVVVHYLQEGCFLYHTVTDPTRWTGPFLLAGHYYLGGNTRYRFWGTVIILLVFLLEKVYNLSFIFALVVVRMSISGKKPFS